MLSLFLFTVAITLFPHVSYAQSSTTTVDAINFHEPRTTRPPHTSLADNAPTSTTDAATTPTTTTISATTTSFDPHAGHNHPTWVPPTLTESTIAADTTTTTATATITSSFPIVASTLETGTTATKGGGTTVTTSTTYQKVATINVGLKSCIPQAYLFLFLLFSFLFL